MKHFLAERSGFGNILWIVGFAGVFIGFFLFAPDFVDQTSVAGARATPPSKSTPIPTVTPSPSSRPTTSVLRFARTLEPQTTLPTPTLGPDAKAFAFNADPRQTGWIRNNEKQPHWGERTLYSGFKNGETYEALLYFDLSSLPPDTRILSASVELVGLNPDRIGASGAWHLRMLQPEIVYGWAQHDVGEFFRAQTMADIGAPLRPEDLATGRVNQFVFSTEQLSPLERAVNTTSFVGFRLDGPVGAPDSLFAWGNSVSNSRTSLIPVLRINAVLGPLVVITNTPTPENVFTAVAQAQTGAAFSSLYGTPTPFPRYYATATPIVVITPQPTPANNETRGAQLAYATLVALTTGTFTPTPLNWVTATPVPGIAILPKETPVLIPVTPVAAATMPGPEQLIQTPVPGSLKGNIMFLSNRSGSKKPYIPYVMRPDGTVLGVLAVPEYYEVALAREPYSPDRSQRAIVARDAEGAFQIWIQDSNTGQQKPLTQLKPKKIAYDPAWSPDGSKIAYVSTETGMPEIFVHDLASGKSRQLTISPGQRSLVNQKPSWSPDNQQIVFKSNRDTGHSQIWVIDADGTDLRNLTQTPYEEADPIWVK
jgi:hypothetical protein